MTAVCWTRSFLEAQGYQVMENIVYQENKSSILLENNGKSSSIKRTKHINIRRISKKELNVEWFPTNEIIGYFLTKPTRGIIFKQFRYLIIGVTPIKKDIEKMKIIRRVSEY